VNFTTTAFYLWQSFHFFPQARTQTIHVDAGQAEQVAHTTAILVQKGYQQVYRFNELVIPAHRQ